MQTILENSVSEITLNNSQFNSLLDEKDPKEISLRGVKLTREQLKKAHRKGIRLRGVILKDLDLSQLDLSKADFSEAIIIGVDFRGYLNGVSFAGATIIGVDFTRAMIKGFFNKAYLSRVKFEGAQMEGTSFIEADIKDADFRTAILHHANFDKATISNADFGNAETEGISFRKTQLHNVEIDIWEIKKEALDGIRLSGASFEGNQDELRRVRVDKNRQIVIDCLYLKHSFEEDMELEQRDETYDQMDVNPLYLGKKMGVDINEDNGDLITKMAHYGDFNLFTMHVTSIKNVSDGKDSIIAICGTEVFSRQKFEIHISCERHSNSDFDIVLGFECNRYYTIMEKNGFWICPPETVT